MDDIFNGNGYLTVGDFARLVGMTAETLRHYDRLGVFSPAQYGMNDRNKYRFYSSTQITSIKMIRVLSEIGVDIETIKELAEDRTPEKLMKLLKTQKRIVADELEFLQNAHSVISTFMDILNEGICATETGIYVCKMPEKRIILGNENSFSDSDGFYSEFVRFCSTPCTPSLNLSFPIGGYFESMDVFLGEPSRPSRFFSLDPCGNERLAEGLYLTGYTRGYYGQTGDLPDRMMAFAKKNGLLFCGPVYNIYLFDEMSIVDTSQYLLQVSALVKETRRRVTSRRPAIHL